MESDRSFLLSCVSRQRFHEMLGGIIAKDNVPGRDLVIKAILEIEQKHREQIVYSGYVTLLLVLLLIYQLVVQAADAPSMPAAV